MADSSAPPRLRVLILDLLVERAEFGHGGNLEVLRPLVAKGGEIECLLLTPQVQSSEVGERAAKKATEGMILLSEEDVPDWDDDFPFWTACREQLDDGMVDFRRIAMPVWPESDSDASADANTGASEGSGEGSGEITDMDSWLAMISPDAVVCTGSRRNVSEWENWMDSCAAVMEASIKSLVPTLGICFGHQLLCKALGGKISRADKRSDAIHQLSLTESGIIDPLFTPPISAVGSDGKWTTENTPTALFTHQDHVVESPDNCILLATAPHNQHVAVRVADSDGLRLPAWGVQFHPEASKSRIRRSFELGHISEQEMNAFEGEHDGAAILANFAEVVYSLKC